MTDNHQTYLQKQIEMHKDLSRVYTEKRYAFRYSMMFQTHWNNLLAQLVDLPPGSIILDFGCGTGILFDTLLERRLKTFGIDLSFEMLASRPQDEAHRICTDGTNTPFPSEAFDAVVCRGSLHHLPDIETAFREIARILKPNGCFVFSEPSNDSLINRLARYCMYKNSQEFHEEDEGFCRSTIIPLLEKNRFAVEVSRGFGFLAYTLAGFPDKLSILSKVPGNCRITSILLFIDRLLESLPVVNRMALHWIVRARKI